MARRIRLFPYYGAKMRLAARYPVPRYGTIIEPFAGSAGYSSLHYTKNVVLYEKDPVVFAVLKYLIGCSPGEILGLPIIPPNKTVDDYVLTREQRWMIGFWLNTAVTAPCLRLSAWGRSLWPNMPVSFWGEACRARLAESVALIKHWRVVNESWEECPDIEATWYIDPPYMDKGRFYPCHEVDYAALAEWCLTRRGQVIVCEGIGASWLPFRPFCEQFGAVVTDGIRKRSGEVIWTGDDE